MNRKNKIGMVGSQTPYLAFARQGLYCYASASDSADPHTSDDDVWGLITDNFLRGFEAHFRKLKITHQ